MTTGEKLTKLRKENGYTQEQLADLLKVSRQAVSRWESDLAFPETEKLIRIAKLYDVSLDYLLLEDSEAGKKEETRLFGSRGTYEYKSRFQIKGLPLVHICLNQRKIAKGFIAVGYRSIGVVSLGLLSLGFISFGVISLGIFSAAALAVGMIALGGIAVGILAAGSIAVGLLALGAIAIGQVSGGALAVGQYFAFGDYAQALVAVGKTQIYGQYSFSYPLTEPEAIRTAVLSHIPQGYQWFCFMLLHL